MKKKWAIGGLLVFVAVILVPIMINALYLINGGYITVWSGADVLAFYGAALGAVGTIILGIVAWEQNKRLLELEETKYKLEMRPFVILTDWRVRPFSIQDILSNPTQIKLAARYLVVGDIHKADLQIFLTFTNTTDSFITAAYHESKYVKNQKSTGWGNACIGSLNDKLRILPNASAEICLLGTRESLSESFRKGAIKVYLAMENRLGEKYFEEFCFEAELFEWRDIFGNVPLRIRANDYKVYPLIEADPNIVD